MPRRYRTKLTDRSQLSACLERLEARQLLSASALVAHAAPPAAQPAGLVIKAVTPISQPAVVSGAAIYNPSQMRLAYGDLAANGGLGTTVAIVDAYKDPNITTDLSIFSTQFGLPQMNGTGGNPTFQVLTPTGQPTPHNAPGKGGNSWAVEQSLDVEWVHSIAPYANIDLIETATNAGDYLYAAEADGQTYKSGVGYAKSLAGVDVITNSYGGGEFSGETFYDQSFNEPASHNPVAITFSTGDSAAPGSYPAYAPNVVAVGGTSLNTLTARGVYGSETGWSGTPSTGASGGGVSLYEPTPSFQSSNGVNFGNRSEPDVSMDANPNTGVWIIDQYDFPGQFIGIGGTSLSSPMFGAVIALGDQARIAGGGTSLSTTGVLTALYSTYNSPSYLTDFHDITVGNNGFAAGPGYDLVTGIGSPKIQNIVPLFAATVDPGPLDILTGTSVSGIPDGQSDASPILAGIAAKTVPTINDASNPVGMAVVTGSGQNGSVAAVGPESISAPAANRATPFDSNSFSTITNSANPTLEGFQSALVNTSTGLTDLAASPPVGIGTEVAMSDTVAPAIAPAGDATDALSSTPTFSLSDTVFADNTAVSIFDSIATTPVATLTSDESHAADLAMIAGMALAVHGLRSAFSRTEETRTLPVLS
jgi:hypothetical protein